MKGGIFLLFLLITSTFVIPIVDAMDVDLTIQTKPLHKLIVRIKDPNLGLIESQYPTADETGKVLVEFESGREKLEFVIIVRDGDNVIQTETIEPMEVKETMYIDLEGGSIAPPEETETDTLTSTSEETQEAETPAEEEIDESKIDTIGELGKGSAITGSAILTKDKIFSKTGYFIMGVLIIGALVIFIMKKGSIISMPKFRSEERIISSHHVISEKLVDDEKRIRELENDIQEIREEEIEETEKSLSILRSIEPTKFRRDVDKSKGFRI